jgi:catechol 2,3-dioxygenase-like lactoylglutathione lyase family enzyme
MSQLHLTEIGRVVIPSADVDKAVDFYRDTLGFDVTMDEKFADGQMRWVELVPPGSSTALAIAPPPPDTKAEPIRTGIIISTSDVEADHKALKDEGVDVDEEIMRSPPPIPPMFQVRDPNGNSVWIVEPLH